MTCMILVFLDSKNIMFYSEIIYFLAFLFFLIQGVSFIKNNNYKLGLIHFLFVIVYVGISILKLLQK